jgi:hypothetical protein
MATGFPGADDGGPMVGGGPIFGGARVFFPLLLFYKIYIYYELGVSIFDIENMILPSFSLSSFLVWHPHNLGKTIHLLLR